MIWEDLERERSLLRFSFTLVKESLMEIVLESEFLIAASGYLRFAPCLL